MDAPGPKKVERKLAAILAADVVGYSRLMGADEEDTFTRLKAHRRELIDPEVAAHHGRVIKLNGDGALIEFQSVVEAVRCAVRIQHALADRNAQIALEKRIVIRIGINLGDVIVEDGDIYGDGINIAARLESIAEPGGICVSDKVHQEMRGKIDVGVRDLGMQTLKNIAEPVRVFRIELGGVTGGVAGPHSLMQHSVLTLPDKPSIAVLPLTNLSGDPSQDYFSDGITEDIITELSRFSELFVIARNSSFQYKGKSPDIRQVGRELGVRYVLEGSVRRAGDRVRITGQLIDATTGTHRWAERYDRNIEDVFAVQDEVVRNIVAIIAAHVNKAETERTLLKSTSTWQAYDYFLQGTDALSTYFTNYDVQTLHESRRFFERSISIDPKYARAFAALSYAYFCSWAHPLDSDYLTPAALERAFKYAQHAVQIDANLPQAHAQLGYMFNWKRQHARAIAEFDRAIALNPNFSDWRFAVVLIYAAEPAKAVQILGAHMRIDPFYPPAASCWLGNAYYMLRRYTDALLPLRECVSRAPKLKMSRAWLAATYAQLEQLEEARAEAVEVLRLEPLWTIEWTARQLNVFKRSEDAEHFFDGLRKAGLPE